MAARSDGTLAIAEDSLQSILAVVPDGSATIAVSPAALLAANGAATTSVDIEGGLGFDRLGRLLAADGASDAVLRFAPGFGAGAVLADRNRIQGATGSFPNLFGDLAIVGPQDGDGDGLSDFDEVNVHGTNPNVADTDGDTIPDGVEVRFLPDLDPTVPNDVSLDSDSDGLTDVEEILNGLDPSDPTDADQDPDADGLTSAAEVALGTDPHVGDTDGDGLSDGDEVDRHGTDPLVGDTDGGGRSDGDEVNADGTDPLDASDDELPIVLPRNLTDGDGFLWDIQRDGSINNGTSDAYDGGLRLSVNGSSFPSNGNATLIGGRQVEMGPSDVGGLRVSRRIFVPDGERGARFLEIIENPGASERVANVSLSTNLGSDSGTQTIATSSGDLVFDPADDFLITDDFSTTGGDPALVHVISGPNAPVRASAASLFSNDNIAVAYNVTVPAGGRVVLMHFAVQSTASEEARTRAPSVLRLQGAVTSALPAGLRDDIVNFFPFPDKDLDKLSDADEAALGTDPTNPDTDGDGITDGREVEVGLDPLVFNDATTDTDGDGVPDLTEVLNGMDPNDPTDAAQDRDSDGLTNAEELTLGTDLDKSDTDGDGLSDGDEVDVHGTDPLVVDTDGGGRGDGDEVNADGTDPLDASDDQVPIAVTGGSGDADHPMPVFDADGNLHMVWDEQGGEGDRELFYTELAPDGSTLIPPTPLTSAGAGVRRPALAVDGAGRVHIVWQDQRVDSGSAEVFYMVIDPSTPGSLVVIPDRLLSPDDGVRSKRPKIAIDPNGDAHVVWEETSRSGEVFYTKIGISTDPITSELVATTLVAPRAVFTGGEFQDRIRPSIAIDSLGSVHLGINEQLGTRDAEIYYMMLDGGDGETIIDATLVTPDDGFRRRFPSIGVMPDDTVVLVYQDQRLRAGGGEIGDGEIEVFMTHFDPALQLAADGFVAGDPGDIDVMRLGPDVLVSDDDGIRSNHPAAIVDSSGIIRVTYFRAISGFGGEATVLFTSLSADGSRRSPEMDVSGTVTGTSGTDETRAFLTPFGDRTVVTWASRQAGSDTGNLQVVRRALGPGALPPP